MGALLHRRLLIVGSILLLGLGITFVSVFIPQASVAQSNQTVTLCNTNTPTFVPHNLKGTLPPTFSVLPCPETVSRGSSPSTPSLTPSPGKAGQCVVSPAAVRIDSVAMPPSVTTTIPVASFPLGVGVNPTTNTICIGSLRRSGGQPGDAVLSVINGETNTITTTISLGIEATLSKDVAVNPITNTIYVTNTGANTVSVINGATNTITATINVGVRPCQLAVNPTTNTIYVTNFADNTVSIIDGATNTVTATINVGVTPCGVAGNPTTNTIYVANLVVHTVSVIDGATNIVTATIDMGGSSRVADVAVNPTTNTIYITNIDVNLVSIISGATNTVTAIVGVGNGPGWLGVNPITNTIYVANGSAGTVSVIDGATRTVTATVSVGVEVGPGPAAGGVNPITNTIYVTNPGVNTVSVIQGSGTPVPTLTPAPPISAPILFVSDRDDPNHVKQQIHSDGTNQPHLITDTMDDTYPSLNPLGTKIVYLSNGSIWTADFNVTTMIATNPTRFPTTADLPTSVNSVSWSSDSNHILVTGVKVVPNSTSIPINSGQGVLEILDMQGNLAVDCSKKPLLISYITYYDNQANPHHKPSDGTFGGIQYPALEDAVMSSDGKIAFTYVDDINNRHEIWLTQQQPECGSLSTPKVILAAINTNNDYFNDYDFPAWSSDGSRLAFVKTVSTIQGTDILAHPVHASNIYVGDISKITSTQTDNSATKLTSNSLTASSPTYQRPRWSSDGTTIFFTSSIDGKSTLSTVSSGGGTPTILPNQTSNNTTTLRLPPSTRSHYITSNQPKDLKAEGKADCEENSQNGIKDALIVLDFGYPGKSDGYGTWYLNGSDKKNGYPFIKIKDIETIIETGYLVGYSGCVNTASTPNMTLTLAIGHSSATKIGIMGTDAKIFGMNWGQMIYDIDKYAQQNFGATFTIAGGIDAEGFSEGIDLIQSTVNDWHDGFLAGACPQSTATQTPSPCPLKYYDFGDCASCGDAVPNILHFWWNISSGPHARPIPEIYNQPQVDEWYNLSRYAKFKEGGSITFPGVMTEQDTNVIKDANNKILNIDVYNKPDLGWEQFYLAINGDPDTRKLGSAIQSTDIKFDPIP